MKRHRFEELLDSLLPGSDAATDTEHHAPPFPDGLGLEPTGVLGHGGVGWVYRARDPVLDRFVAVKVARADGGAVAREALLREARVTASLEHPAVLPVHRIVEASGALCVEFRAAPVTTLAARLGDTRSPEDPAWPAAERRAQLRQIADALATAHARGVVHGDLHPGNVALGARGEPYVLDWGGVVHQPGTFSGTPEYAAPEQLAGGGADSAADVYALGGIAWELCAARPHRARRPREDIGDFVARWRDADPTSLSTFVQVEPALDALILEALSHDPAARPTAAAFVARLDAVMSGAEERKRRAAHAEKLLDKARASLDLHKDLERRVVAERQAVAVLGAKIPGHSPVAQKRPLWEAEDRIARLSQESQAAWLVAAERATVADTLAPGDRTRQARAEAWWEWMRLFEAARDPLWPGLLEPLVRLYDTGPYTRAMDSPSHVSLEASVPGARVTIARLVERDRRLVPEVVDERTLPLERLPLNPGSWLLTVRAEGHAEARYPLWLDRLDHHRGRVKLYTPGQVGEGWCFVPAASFQMGGDPRARQQVERCAPWVGDRFVSRTAVTTAQWLDFLADLPDDEAKRRAPGEWGLFGGFEGLWHHDERGWALPEGWLSEWPVMAISLRDAEAYAAWVSRRLRCAVRLPTEEEWEKAARGVDGRGFPWGNGFDPTYAHMRRSIPEAPHPAPVASYPIDESVYGVRDMAGCIREWTSSPYDTGAMALRGGSWGDDPDDCRCAFRSGLRPEFRYSFIGFRLIREEPLPG